MRSDNACSAVHTISGCPPAALEIKGDSHGLAMSTACRADTKSLCWRLLCLGELAKGTLLQNQH